MRNGLGKCEGFECGIDARVIHHIDRNRRNNNPDNLRRFCYSCHRKEHYYDGDGKTIGTDYDAVDEMARNHAQFRIGGRFETHPSYIRLR